MSIENEGDAEKEEQSASMRGPLVALAVIVVLVLGTLYLAHVLTGVSKIQDCVMAGRRNCAPITP